MVKTSRTRTKDHYQVFTSRKYRKDTNETLATDFPGISLGETSSISDDNNGPFRFLQSKGIPVFSDCVISRVVRTATPGSLESKYRKHEGYFAIPTFGGVPNTTFPVVESLSVLLVKASADMKKSELLAGEMVSSLGQTVSMLRKPFASAQSLLVKVYKNRNWRMRRKSGVLARATAESWLEYRYGWLPIISDGKKIIETARKQLATSNRRLIARAGSRQSSSTTVSWPATQNGSEYASQGSHTLTKKVSRDVGIMYEVSLVQASEALAQTAGVRLCDFPATVWEVIPFSFVADWFVNAGDWIRAITPTPGISPINNWCTDISETISSISAECQWPAGYYYYPLDQFLGSYGTNTEKSFSMTRDTRIELPPTPSLRINGLSWKQQADALALSITSLTNNLRGLRH